MALGTMSGSISSHPNQKTSVKGILNTVFNRSKGASRTAETIMFGGIGRIKTDLYSIRPGSPEGSRSVCSESQGIGENLGDCAFKRNRCDTLLKVVSEKRFSTSEGNISNSQVEAFLYCVPNLV
jgi:hypothetical protein